MVEIGVSLNAGKEEKKSDLEAPLGELGVHVWTDRHFDKRVEKNLETTGKTWDEAALALLDISPVKKQILRRVGYTGAYIEENVPHGRAVEKPKVSAAVVAMNELLLMAEDLAFGDTPDRDALLLANDYLSRARDIVWHTFDTKNTTLNKAFTVQQQGPQGQKGEMTVVGSGGAAQPTV